MTRSPTVVDALVVIDMQNSFCHSDGTMYESLGAPLHGIDEAVQCTSKAVAQCRDRGVPVVFVRHRYQPGHVDFGPLFPQFRELLQQRSGLLANTWDTEVVEPLGLRPTDPVIEKSRLDAFHGTGLDLLLRSLGASRIAMAGVLTNVCVETSARAAAIRDYHVTVLSDCTASRTAADRDASLRMLVDYHIADVQPGSHALELR